jgi:dinuclear metal center YbgI/SA1388 family protein
MNASPTTLKTVLEVLEEIAPLQYAEDWDNTGLLLEPVPAADHAVASILLTIDLTEAVVAEACELQSQIVVAYHPLIFHPLNSLTQADSRHRSLLRAAKFDIAIYSPHTALDAAPQGVNDWLADGLPPGRRVTIKPCAGVEAVDGTPVIGQGRLLELDDPLSLREVADLVKKHLGLEKLRVATAPCHERGEKIRRIAICAGAGGEVVAGTDAQLYLTGEMRHHYVLAALEAGRTTILCEHTNTERGYLKVLQARIRALLPDLQVHVSQRDREPLEVV